MYTQQNHMCTQQIKSNAPVVIELSGGLGNQLFQYNFGLLLSLLGKCPLLLDITSIMRDVYRYPDIVSLVPGITNTNNSAKDDTTLNTQAAIYGLAYVSKRKCLFKILGTRVLSSLSRWERLIHKIVPYQEAESNDRYMFFDEKNNGYQNSMYYNNTGIQDELSQEQSAFLYSVVTQEQSLPLFVRGYWQDMRLFRVVQNMLHTTKRVLCTLSSPQQSTMEQTKAVLQKHYAIDFAHATVAHVRRTDFLLTAYPQCTVVYYKEAVQEVINNDPKAQFLVFSDDAQWCIDHLDIAMPFVLVTSSDIAPSRVTTTSSVSLEPLHVSHQRISGEKKIYKHNLTAVDEMLLMNYCTHYIHSNSSFAWWGSRLLSKKQLHAKDGSGKATNNNKSIVVAPFPWTEKMNKVSTSFYGREWQVLDITTGKPVQLKTYVQTRE